MYSAFSLTYPQALLAENNYLTVEVYLSRNTEFYLI